MKNVDDFAEKEYAIIENGRYILTEKGVKFINKLFSLLEITEEV